MALSYDVVSFDKINSGVYHLRLAPVTSRLEFVAGQYVEIGYPEITFLPYSIANAPRHDGSLDFYIRDVVRDEPLQKLFHCFEQKKRLELLGAKGNCVYQQQCDYPIIMLAGGVGISQIKSLLEQALVQNDQRMIYLYWGLVNVGDLFAPRWLMDWLCGLSQFSYKVVVQNPGASHWHGRTGFVQHAVTQDFKNLSNVQVYVSGSWPMVDAAVAYLQQYGLEDRFIYSDRFAFIEAPTYILSI